MEIVIVICLLIVIVLLLQDKIVIKKRDKTRTSAEKVNPNLPDIMGQTKAVEAFQCQTLPMKAKLRNRR
jgi:hypothetical protein